jgi:glycosyltransferase involved in cell wall biosynthesis
MLHMVEPGGRGGVFQHAVAVAQAAARDGRPVTLHTADDCEFQPQDVSLCRCVKWHRKLPGPLKKVASALAYGKTLAHLASAMGAEDGLHFQGSYKLPLTWATLIAGKLRAKKVIFSPHNTFARDDSRMSAWLLQRCIRTASTTVAYSQADLAAVKALGGNGVLEPLVQSAPSLDPAAVRSWTERWDAQGRAVVLFAGQLRADKRLDLVIKAAASGLSPKHIVVAVVGEDKGSEASNRRLAQELGVPVRWDVRYVSLEEFAAALAAADLVVCPYDRASQSGVLSLARLYGARTLATDVGGLAELADVTVLPDDALALAEGIKRALTLPRRALAVV